MTIDDDTDQKPEPTFTRGQMAREVARQVREKVAAALAEYGDLNELRTKAEQADKQRSQLDRIEQQLAAQTKRAEAAERETLIRSVAEELGIPMRLAGRLTGSTRAELLADGRETMDELGIKPKGKATSNTPAAEDGDVGDDGVTTDEQQEQQEEAETPAQREPARRIARPREQLQSAAPRTPPAPEVTDPLKLAAAVPRR